MSWSRNTQRETRWREPETTRRAGGKKRKNKTHISFPPAEAIRATRRCKLKLWNSTHIFYFFQGYILIRHTGKVVAGQAWPVSRRGEVGGGSRGEEKVERARRRRNGATRWEIEARLWGFWQSGGRWERCKMKDSERERQRNRQRERR